jgi:predicted  nucleic acid-binding Zn-ribbon protein
VACTSAGPKEEEAMPKLLEIIAWERRIRQQKREIRELRGEVEKLQTQNEHMRDAMRRCLSCEYRARPPLPAEMETP